VKKKVVLAFSGGLDTSFCVKYLSEEKGYEVHTITINTGGFDQAEVKAIEDRAKSLGVASHKTVDETKNYYDTVIKFLIYGNVLKNNTYTKCERRTYVAGIGHSKLCKGNKG
jgi:argininosuccinate synthase